MTVATATVPPAKRRKGRPAPGESDGGRELLLVAAEKLLHVLPPARVTIPRIAREAGVDPSLVYYYFGSRAALLMAVVDRVTKHPLRMIERTGDPVDVLVDHIGRTVQLARRAPFLNRLMIDELAQIESADATAHLREMTQDLVDFYRELLDADGGQRLVEVDPFNLFVAVLGASDFLSSAQPLLRKLLPPDADIEQVTADYQAFLVELLMHGMVKR